MEGRRILVVDDEELMQITLRDALLKAGYQVTLAQDGEEGLKEFLVSKYDLALIDLKMPKIDGLELLSKIKEASPDALVIIMTAYGTIETAVQAMKLGAYDYITKPFLIEELIMMVERVFHCQSLQEENLLLRQELSERYQLDQIVGKNEQMQEIYKLIETVAQRDSTVIIYGESGTGKELVANAIHRLSSRRDRPFIKVSCAVFPETLLESELFGHEKGAFTGAINRRLGRFELADLGTLFLDDVDDMSPAVQVKLLRVLQEREFERLGGSQTIRVDVRLIAASKGNLEEKVEVGRFREDLYYRLNVVPIYLPPLRQRKDDIPLLVNHFITKYAQRAKREVKGLSREALSLMLEYDWPGNVQELENAIERAIVLGRREEIMVDDLPSPLREDKRSNRETSFPQGTSPLEDFLKRIEKEHIIRVLKETRGRKREAAKVLGISRKTLWQKIKDYGIKEKGSE